MSPTPADADVTAGEFAVIQAYLEAGSIKGAADRLGIAESTAKNHMANARSRLGAKTTAEVVLRLAARLAA